MIFLKLVGITVICVMALKIVLSEGMLLEKLGSWLEYKTKDQYMDGVLVSKANKFYELFICQWCMGTLQSVTAHLFAFGLGIITFEFTAHFIIRWVLVIMASSFINGNLWNLYETVNRIKERNEAEREFLISADDLANIIIGNNIEDIIEQQEYENKVFNNQHN